MRRDPRQLPSRYPLIIALAVLTTPVALTAPTALDRARASTGQSPSAALVPVAPCRLLDTRLGERPAEGAVVRVQAAGSCGVPDAASSVVVTITATDPTGPGFVTGWSGAGDAPIVSNVNFAAGETRANSAVLALADGSFALISRTSVHLVVDVAGAFVPTDASSAGRFVPIEPVRVTDTRTRGPLEPGATVRVPLPAGVPMEAIAVAITLTTADAVPGYFTATPAGAPRSVTSVLNTDAPGQTRAVGAILPVSADGLDVFSSAGSPVIADVTGYFTGGSARRSADGLYVAVEPRRLLDTRGVTPLYGNGSILIGPADGVAAVVNVTMVANRFAGFVSAVPAGVGAEPAKTSVVNADRRMATAASLAVVPASTLGIELRSSTTTHALVDLFGRFTGTPVAATGGASTIENAPVDDPPVRALLVGDSTMAGIRWYGSSRIALAGDVSYVLDAQSCRRLAQPSCHSREGGYPINVVQVLARLTAPVDVLVVQAGYDDSPAWFGSSFARVVEAARAKGIGQVIWLSYRSSVSYVFPGFSRSLGNGYVSMNATLRERAGGVSGIDVMIADYDHATTTTSGWFEADGIHLTRTGAYGTADYIARWIAWANALPCPAPETPGGAVATWCPNPDSRPPIDVAALYGA